MPRPSRPVAGGQTVVSLSFSLSSSLRVSVDLLATATFSPAAASRLSTSSLHLTGTDNVINHVHGSGARGADSVVRMVAGASRTPSRRCVRYLAPGVGGSPGGEEKHKRKPIGRLILPERTRHSSSEWRPGGARAERTSTGPAPGAPTCAVCGGAGSRSRTATISVSSRWRLPTEACSSPARSSTCGHRRSCPDHRILRDVSAWRPRSRLQRGLPSSSGWRTPRNAYFPDSLVHRAARARPARHRGPARQFPESARPHLPSTPPSSTSSSMRSSPGAGSSSHRSPGSPLPATP